MTARPYSGAPTARDAVLALAPSRIREVANAGLGDPDVLPFWFGEPDEVTPAFIRKAGIAAIERGETFYAENLGIPELREAVAAYVSRLHRPTAMEEVAVTSSGMSALMLAVQALVEPGNRVVVVTPLWPNLTEIPKILAGHVVRVPLQFTPGGWMLDTDRLLDALAPGTRVLLINSPNNPTGWTLEVPAIEAILAHCRPRHLDRGRRRLRAALLRSRGLAARLRAGVPRFRDQ
jgi:aspartate/methionine/tyrosine aminotransferase